MKLGILKNFVIFWFITSITFASEISLEVLKVSQANFLILKNQNNGLVFDCGSKEAGWIVNKTQTFTDAKRGIINGLLNGITNLTIVISHNHDDHFNLLIPLIKLAKESMPTINIIKSWEKNREEITTAVTDALGREIEITPLFATISSSFPHDNNLVLKISVNGKNILLTGDASGRLIKQISEDIMDTDVLLFSHHGGNESQELSLIDIISRRDLSIRPLLGIISSDVSGISRIPKYYPNYKSVKNPGNTFMERMYQITIPLSEMNNSYFCRYHDLTFYDQSIDSEYTDPAVMMTDLLKILPIFSTGDIGKGFFYRIFIDVNGSIIMNQHGDDLPLYYRGDNPFSLPETFNPKFEIVSGIAKITKAIFENRRQAYEKISTVFRYFPAPNKTLFCRQKDLEMESSALLTLRNSKYIAEVEKLKRLISLLIPISKDIKFPGRRTENLITHLIAFNLVEPSDDLDTEFVDFLLQNGIFKLREESDEIEDVRNLLWTYLSHDLKNKVMLEWLTTKLREQLFSLSDIHLKAMKILFLENYPDQTIWNLFILKHNLLGNNYLSIRNFLITSLYNTSIKKTNLCNALLNSIKHYTENNGYQEDEIFYYNKNTYWLKRILGNPSGFKDFLQFLIENDVFRNE